MKQHSQTLFFLEYMQPNWLLGGRAQRVYEWLGVRLPACLMGILVSILLGAFVILLFTLGPGTLCFDMILALVGGWLGLLWSGGTLARRSAEETAQSVQHTRLSVIRGENVASSLLIGAGMGLTFGLGAGPWNAGDGLRAGLLLGVISGLVFLLLAAFMEQRKTARASNGEAKRPKRRTWYARISNEHIARGGLVGNVLGLGMGIPFAVLQVHGSLSALPLAVISAWVILGVSNGIEATFLSAILVGKNSAIEPVEQLVWSWSSLWQSLTSRRHLRDGSFFALIIGLGFGLFEPGNGWVFKLIIGLLSGLTSGLIYWLLFGFFQAVKGETLDEQSHILPNQGISRSARNGLLFGCISGGISIFILLGLSIVLFWIQVTLLISVGLVPARYSTPALDTLGLTLNTILHYGLFIGLACGLLLGLLNGWLACLRHVILRWLLWRHQTIPWNYPRFLDYAAERILLRKVGGGYIFLHRLLLDYFADLETEPCSVERGESKQERLQPDTMPSVSVEPIGAKEHWDVSTIPLAPTLVLSDIPCLLPCGHELRGPGARFCSICGTSITTPNPLT